MQHLLHHAAVPPDAFPSLVLPFRDRSGKNLHMENSYRFPYGSGNSFPHRGSSPLEIDSVPSEGIRKSDFLRIPRTAFCLWAMQNREICSANVLPVHSRHTSIQFLQDGSMCQTLPFSSHIRQYPEPRYQFHLWILPNPLLQWSGSPEYIFLKFRLQDNTVSCVLPILPASDNECLVHRGYGTILFSPIHVLSDSLQDFLQRSPSVHTLPVSQMEPLSPSHM